MVGLLLAGMALMAVVGNASAVAMKHTGSTTRTATSSLALVLLDSSDGLAHYGQVITFNAATTATTQPWVKLNCYANGAWIYTSNAGFFPSYPWGQDFVLSGPSWPTGSAADCTATLFTGSKSGHEVDLATLNFHVYA